MKALVVYYSYGGNTKSVAERIASALNAETARIETVTPYTGSYDSVVNQGQQEVNSGFTPKIKPLSVNLSDYDTIVLGTPVWWYTFAPAVHTFLKSNSLSGKNVYPFATNGGWLGHTFEDLQTACPGAKLHTGLNIPFNGKQQSAADSVIDKWVQKIL